jgi:hypothetical protein
MASTTTVDEKITTANGSSDEDMLARARAIVAAQEAKEAEKARKAAERKAAREAAGEQPNAAHQMLKTIVNALVAADTALSDAKEYRDYIRSLTGLVDTAAKMPNVTTAVDFKVIGSLIDNTRPTVPVS